ncbi:tyrosine-type recombinase/integrase [Lysinibacillus sp. NPDC095746]|uniref:tyrosine-type recombinase/integrase n=1 Tax=Lysinibacillus sp. NPDC095746 TaxID=3364134 RepID=UPI0038188A5B
MSLVVQIAGRNHKVDRYYWHPLITPLITVHRLRHTHASILLFEEVNLIYVSERLGHSSIEITSSTYAHVLKELRKRDSRKTADVFKKDDVNAFN